MGDLGQRAETLAEEASPASAFAESLARTLGFAYRVALYRVRPPGLLRAWGSPRTGASDPVPALISKRPGDVVNHPVRGRRRLSVLRLPDGEHAVAIELDAAAASRAARLLATIADPDGGEPEPIRLDHVGDALDRLVTEAEHHVGVPVDEMSRTQKQDVVRFLDERGAFLIKKAVEDVAGRLGVSRFTIYNYLDQANRGTRGGSSPGAGERRGKPASEPPGTGWGD